MAQGGLSRPQRGQQWLHRVQDPGSPTSRHVLFWLCGSGWLHLGGSSPRRRVCTLLVPQRAFAAGPDHDLHRSTVWHSEDGKNQVLSAMGYSEAAKKHE